jgi:ADP-heptose:LPS heptosyltransferase
VPSHSLAASLDLADLAALLGSSDLLVANNTGPVHVAAAVGTPHRCLRPVDAGEAYQAACELLL